MPTIIQSLIQALRLALHLDMLAFCQRNLILICIKIILFFPNVILSQYFVSIATNVAPLDLQMSTQQLLYFLETLFRVDGEVYCYSRSFLLLIYMYKVHHCPIS